jgi:hypothetical protein
MRENGLNARIRGKHILTTNSTHGLAVCVGLKVRNIPGRMFHAEAGGEKRMPSYPRYAITYLRTASGWVYLTKIRYISRKIKISRGVPGILLIYSCRRTEGTTRGSGLK